MLKVCSFDILSHLLVQGSGALLLSGTIGPLLTRVVFFLFPLYLKNTDLTSRYSTLGHPLTGEQPSSEYIVIKVIL